MAAVRTSPRRSMARRVVLAVAVVALLGIALLPKTAGCGTGAVGWTCASGPTPDATSYTVVDAVEPYGIYLLERFVTNSDIRIEYRRETSTLPIPRPSP